MARSDSRTLINMGRKAGLNTTELYSALAGHQPTAQELESGVCDGNGFVAGFDAAGRQVYRPEGLDI